VWSSKHAINVKKNTEIVWILVDQKRHLGYNSSIVTNKECQMSTVQFAGFSRLQGELKFRTANDTKRINQLRKLGDTDVVILQLPSDMSKNEAAKYVLTNLAVSYADFDTAEAKTLLTSIIKDENPFAKSKKTMTVKKASKIKISKRAAEADDVKLTPAQAARAREEWNAQHAHLSYDGE
jgi:hypothetical protein